MGFHYDGKGLKGQAYTPIPDGEYELEVAQATEAITKKDGLPMVKVKLRVVGPEFVGKTLFKNVVFMPKDKPGALMTIFWLKAIDEPAEGEFEVMPERWVGKRLKAKVITEVYEGAQQNVIKYVKPTAQVVGAPAEGAPPENDDPPF